MSVVAIIMAVLVAGCSSTPTPQPIKSWYLGWRAGTCHDRFIVYQRSGDGWLKLGETVGSKYKLPISAGERIEVTVSGVCSEGEWQSAETLVVQR